MKERSFDEMIAYFNRRVADMDISQEYKMELLGMVTALGYKHKKSAQQWIPCKTRLPKDLEEVNVTGVNHRPESYYEFVKDKTFTASAVYYKGDWYWYSSACVDYLAEYGENEIDIVDDDVEITAWKPIGEPWKGEQS